MEFTLLGAAFVAVVPLYGLLYWEARRGNAASCARNLWDVSLSAIVAGIFVGRLVAMIADGVNPITNPADILIIRGGVATVPATITAVATAAWLGRRELWAALDGLAAASVAGVAGWHAGCVVRDSCLGTPSDLPWATAQGGSAVTRHPVELYAAVGMAVVAIGIAAWRHRSYWRPGIAAGVALTSVAALRLVTEPLRPRIGSGMAAWYLLGMALGIGFTIWRFTKSADDGAKSAGGGRTG